MLFDKFYEYNEWCKSRGINNAADLNEIVTTGKTADLIRICEAYYNNQLENISKKISELKMKPRLILMARSEARRLGKACVSQCR